MWNLKKIKEIAKFNILQVQKGVMGFFHTCKMLNFAIFFKFCNCQGLFNCFFRKYYFTNYLEITLAKAKFWTLCCVVNDGGMETSRGTDQGYAGVGVRVWYLKPLENPYPCEGYRGYKYLIFFIDILLEFELISSDFFFDQSFDQKLNVPNLYTKDKG